ncbi:MAG: transposase [Myxococcales bacterium]|nr:MAG: transposase [Myxococcales bacterium]
MGDDLAKRALALSSVDEAKTDSLTFVQRFDSALRLNPHLHVLILDGARMWTGRFPQP